MVRVARKEKDAAMAERPGGRRRSRRDSVETGGSLRGTPPTSKERRTKRSSKPSKERWLLTRKTWRYMADAGRRLIPDGAHNRPEDIPKIEQYFQEVCQKEPRFLLWRKASYPGTLGFRSQRRRRQVKGGSCRTKASSADEADEVARNPAKEKFEPKFEEILLLHQNHKQVTSTMLAQKHSSVFHAGVIGHGPRRPPPENTIDKEIIALNKILLVDVIKACCSNRESERYPVNLDALTMVSLLLVELVSPDVMYNGLPWPDEEFTKVTIERDLQIRRTFKDVPLLWTLLELTAWYRPALAYCSVLLRGIAATVMANWNIEEGTLLVSVMALGQLLPPPLASIRDILPILEPHQINTIMKECVWAYMRENVPSPALFTRSEGANIAWRDTDTSTPNLRFTETLRLVLLANIHILGPLYAALFYNENK